MRNLFFHTHGIRCLVAGFFFTFLSLSPQAQDTFAQQANDTAIAVPSVVSTDSIYTTPENEETDTVIYFDAVGPAESLPVAERRIADTAWQSLYRDNAFWYANEKPFRENEEPSGSFYDWLAKNRWLRTLLWFIIIGSFVVIVIWFLAAGQKTIFRKKPVALSGAEAAALSTDIFSIDFEKEIANAVNDKNFRLAVRLMYLEVLRGLAQKNILQYKLEKPNSDYVWQLNRTPYYNGFFRLTRHFEYTWYGQFALTEPIFERLRTDFATFKQSLPA